MQAKENIGTITFQVRADICHVATILKYLRESKVFIDSKGRLGRYVFTLVNNIIVRDELVEPILDKEEAKDYLISVWPDLEKQMSSATELLDSKQTPLPIGMETDIFRAVDLYRRISSVPVKPEQESE